MSLLFSSTATATVAANTNAITISGLDLGTALPGMTISLGARGRLTGDAYIIATVAPTGTSGGTLTTVDPVTSAYNSAAFVIDTRDFNGTAPNYLIATYTQVLNALLRLTSPLTNLFTGSRQVALDKDNSSAVSRLLYAIAGRTWGGLEQRTLTYTPTGAGQTATEILSLRAYPDGTTPVDALAIDLATGGGDLRKSSVTMQSAASVDLSSAPVGKIALSGGGTITSFGPGRHLERLVHVVDGGVTLTHNAVSLILPGGANITTSAGDCFHATSDGSGNWRVRAYQRASGAPLTDQRAFRNLLLNPGFVINTRAWQFSALSAGAYGLDRWKAGSGGCSVSNGGGTPEASVIIQSGSLVQVVEGRGVAGGDYVLSWVSTATARVGVGSPSGGAFAVSPVRVSNVPAGSVIYVEFSTGGLYQPQLEAGGTVTTFERRPRQIEENLCARYFQLLGGWSGAIQEGSGNLAFLFGRLPTRMRVAPTVALLDATNLLARPNVANITPSGIAFSAVDVEGGYLGFSVPSQTPGVFVGMLRANGVTLDAEL